MFLHSANQIYQPEKLDRKASGELNWLVNGIRSTKQAGLWVVNLQLPSISTGGHREVLEEVEGSFGVALLFPTTFLNSGVFSYLPLNF